MVATTPFDDGSVELASNPLLATDDNFALAVFGSNMAGGTNLVTRECGAPLVTWAETLAIARAAESAGIEAIVPVARWRGPSPDTDPQRHRSFEPFTWAAGVAAATERIQVITTLHVPLIHPVRAAKEIATVDHISSGRLGVNVVAGWNPSDFQMFGIDLAEHDHRYAISHEWMDVLEQVFTTPQPFDFDGRFFQGRAIISQPLPVQRPRPLVMSAGFSPAGREFAARRADINFVITPDRAAARIAIAQVKQAARAVGRELKVFGALHVLCRDDDTAAQRAYRRFIDESGDRPAARAAIASLMGESQSAHFDVGMEEAAMFGFFATPLVGSPAHVVEQIAEMRTDGLDGAAISWVDYHEGLAQFSDVLGPLMVEAGLRRRPSTSIAKR